MTSEGKQKAVELTADGAACATGQAVGLDTARRIVVGGHSGSLRVASKPDCTTLKVSNPLNAATQRAGTLPDASAHDGVER